MSFRNSWKREIAGSLITGTVIAAMLLLAGLGIAHWSVMLLLSLSIFTLYYFKVYPLIYVPVRSYDNGRLMPLVIFLVVLLMFTAALSYSVKGSSAILLAARGGNATIVKILLALGTDPNSVKGAESSPLEMAIMSGNIKVVETLIENGADVNVRDSRGGHPIHLAAGQGHADILSLLIASGADPDSKYAYFGATPLMIAADNGFLEAARVLIGAGARVNVRGKLNWDRTPLMLAAENCSKEMVELLLANGARVNIKSTLKNTALMLSGDCKDKEITTILERYAAEQARSDTDSSQ